MTLWKIRIQSKKAGVVGFESDTQFMPIPREGEILYWMDYETRKSYSGVVQNVGYLLTDQLIIIDTN